MTYDAGGGELTAAFVKNSSQHQFLCLVEGPSEIVFKKRVPRQKRVSFKNFERKLKLFGPELVIATANWGTKLHLNLWEWAKKEKVKSILYLERWPLSLAFLEGGGARPDAVWLCSKEGPSKSDLRKSGMLKTPFLKKKNFYLKAQRENVRRLKKKLGLLKVRKRVLYVAENISTAEKVQGLKPKTLRGYDEYEAMQFFLERMKRESKSQKSLEIRIRPHPSEAGGKYEHLFSQFSEISINLSPNNSSLEHDLAWSNLVVGTQSNALQVAEVCRKPVMRMIPPVRRSK